ncbi:hypothetical protein [Rhizobium sp. Root1240]|uniref:hypothetical protein n=1 Tax=Rhizobium sp. Root1240 TaxID=1736437 RepID=UPI0012E34776|nr:hypothetical protein [Rhizobium sp. Root1240]
MKFGPQAINVTVPDLLFMKLMKLRVNFRFSPEFTTELASLERRRARLAVKGDSCGLPLILDSHRLLEIEEDSISLFFIEGA